MPCQSQGLFANPEMSCGLPKISVGLDIVQGVLRSGWHFPSDRGERSGPPKKSYRQPKSLPRMKFPTIRVCCTRPNGTYPESKPSLKIWAQDFYGLLGHSICGQTSDKKTRFSTHLPLNEIESIWFLPILSNRRRTISTLVRLNIT